MCSMIARSVFEMIHEPSPASFAARSAGRCRGTAASSPSSARAPRRRARPSGSRAPRPIRASSRRGPRCTGAVALEPLELERLPALAQLARRAAVPARGAGRARTGRTPAPPSQSISVPYSRRSLLGSRGSFALRRAPARAPALNVSLRLGVRPALLHAAPAPGLVSRPVEEQPAAASAWLELIERPLGEQLEGGVGQRVQGRGELVVLPAPAVGVSVAHERRRAAQPRAPARAGRRGAPRRARHPRRSGATRRRRARAGRVRRAGSARRQGGPLVPCGRGDLLPGPRAHRP